MVRLLAKVLAASMFQIGQILDNRYQLVESLKMAGVRQTWRSIDLTRQTTCVVKLLGFHPTLRWQDYEQFEREIKILKSLTNNSSEEEPSRRIPRYLTHFSLEAEGMHWSVLVQEEMPGTSLQTLIDQHYRLSEAEIRHIAIELLHILIDLHGHYPPILHRDINPRHIILGPDRSVYLVNFGAAGAISGSLFDEAIGNLSEHFSDRGTYGYVPLEQFGGRAVPASDLYAVGATLLHLLTGVCPADLLQDHHQFQFRSLIDRDDRFAAWLTKLLESNVDQRFQTAKQALTALTLADSEIVSQSDAIEFTSETSQVSNSSVTVRSAPSLEKSASARVKIAALPDQIQVNIGRRGIRFADALWLGAGALTGGVSVMMLFSHVHPALSLLCWLDSLPLFGIGLISALGEASLTIQSANCNSVTLQWKCLGIPYRRSQQSSSIMAIDSATSGITIQTKERQHSVGQFSPPLSEAESEWIVGEVRQWLRK